MILESDFWNLDYIVCPWCEETYEEFWQIMDDVHESEEIKCSQCNKFFLVDPTTTIKFSMEKVK